MKTKLISTVAAASMVMLFALPANVDAQSRGSRSRGPVVAQRGPAPRAVARPPVRIQNVRPVVRVSRPPVRVYRPPVRSSFSLGFSYGYPAYGYGYGSGYPAYGYGYSNRYPYPSGGYYGARPYGALRIVDAPRSAAVYADGYYVGIVDDFDGIFQSLDLTTGPHQIEVRVPGYPSIVADVYIQPGRTLTFRARMQ
jgi:PEGA domain-containing protein